MAEPEVWMRGPVEGIPPLLMPVAHALLGAREDFDGAVGGLSREELWARPNGAASAAFHLAHAGGSLDRLFTYARGEALGEAQRAVLEREKDYAASPGWREGLPAAGELLAAFAERVDAALAQLRATGEDQLLAPRGVGRLQLPSNVLGLLFHAAEHTQRHVGQVVTTARIVRGGGASGAG